MRRLLPGTILAVLILSGAGLGLVWSLQPAAAPDRPKLVVVLVFDQMRGDYLKKWQPLFGEGGFKRLCNDGAWFTNCHYPYAITLTAPGHTSLLTGCTPNIHGIVGNEWYDRKVRRRVSAVDAGAEEDEKNFGPQRRLVPTLGDVLLGRSKNSKMAGLSVKPRSAIFLSALRAQICYWLSNMGLFETSLHYRKEAHPWIDEFNASKKVGSYIDQPWDRFKPGLDYAKFSGPDDVAFEGPGYKQGHTFPHPTPNLGAVVNSPYGNDILLALAKKAIIAEKLGQRDEPDLLCLSFSSNDSVGHCYGPDSQEVLDITLRSDIIVKDLLDFLDKHIGKGNYAVALSADHGVCPIPEVALSQGKDAGYVSQSVFTSDAEAFLRNKFGAKEVPWIEEMEKESYDSHVFVNPDVFKKLKDITHDDVEKALAEWLVKQPGIQAAYPRTMLLSKQELKDPLAEMVRLSVIPDSCGEAVAVLKPYYLVGNPIAKRKKDSHKNYATTHGSAHSYDTHVPLLIMGQGVRPGVHEDRVAPQAMAFILARMLQIEPPSAAVAKYRPPESLWKVAGK
jgi:predicted AlkP superfamily pyrophosphatase or phosphodiesterase